MAGSAMTFTYDEGNDGIGQHCNVKQLICAWTSDSAAGACSSATATLTGANRKIVGRLVKAVTVPGAGGAAPTDNYDITLKDEQANDVLAACQKTLVDRDTANTEEVYFLVLDGAGTPLAQSLHPVVCNVLTIAVANAGNSKTGTIILYYEPV